jgi:hypothetical protein
MTIFGRLRAIYVMILPDFRPTYGLNIGKFVGQFWDNFVGEFGPIFGPIMGKLLSQFWSNFENDFGDKFALV